MIDFFISGGSSGNVDGKKELHDTLVSFPYFQLATMLFAKQLNDSGELSASDKLKLASVYAPDRKALYWLYFNSDNDNKNAGSPPESESVDSHDAVISTVTTINPKPVIVIEGEKVSEPTINKQSFSDWFKFLRHEDVIKDIFVKSDKPSASELINKFLKDEVRITRPKAEFFSPTKTAKRSIEDDESIVSETLAKLYIGQGNYEKGLKAYQTLIGLYPGKSTIFANRIKEIQEKMREEEQKKKH